MYVTCIQYVRERKSGYHKAAVDTKEAGHESCDDVSALPSCGEIRVFVGRDADASIHLARNLMLSELPGLAFSVITVIYLLTSLIALM